MTLDDVRELALALPGAEEGISRGVPAFKVDGRMFACEPTHRSAEPESLVVCIDFDRRDELIAAEPAVYYLKQHYVNYQCVLVRLGRVQRDALKDLLAMAHRFISARGRRRGRLSRSVRPRGPIRSH